MELLPQIKPQFWASSTTFLAGGKLFIYASGTTTKSTIYSDRALTSTITNPIVLNTRGEPTSDGSTACSIWLADGAYKFVLTTSTDTDPPGSPIWTVDQVIASRDIYDENGNIILHVAKVASAVNYITITNAATGNKPSVAGDGGDTNVGLTLKGKGAGAVVIGQSTGTVTIGQDATTATTLTSSGLILSADQALLDSSSNAYLKFSKTGSAINQITIGNAATGNGPTITTTGTDTNTDITLAAKGTGKVKLGQATSTGISLVADQALLDSSNNEYLKFSKTPSAINELTVTNAAIAGSPKLAATGDDTNISITMAGKGTGAVLLGQSTTVGVELVADQPLLDSSANEYVTFSKTASAVNQLTITNAATGNDPTLSATGDDTNISLKLQAKGTGVYKLLGSSTAPAEIRLYENTTNGTNYVAIKAGTSIAADFGWILPNADSAGGFQSDGAGNISIGTLTTTPATQAQQEAASATTVAVTPGRQHFHPSAPKMWASITWSAGTPSTGESYNVTSLTDTGVGVVTINHTNNMSAATYAVVAIGGSDGVNAGAATISSRATNATQIRNSRTETPYTAIDPTVPVCVAIFGDMP